jgi:hypothetical protein
VRVFLDECVDWRLASQAISVVVLRARSNRLAELRQLIPKLMAALKSAQTGAVTFVDADPGHD